MSVREPRRCVAPLGDDDALCGRVATTRRVVEGLACPLCAEHAAEIDRDADETDHPNTDTEN